MTTTLSPKERRVFDVLDAQHDVDVPIPDLFLAAGFLVPSRFSRREQQMKLGPIVARINGKLKHARIVPGELKGTYRLNVSRRSDNK